MSVSLMQSTSVLASFGIALGACDTTRTPATPVDPHVVRGGQAAAVKRSSGAPGAAGVPGFALAPGCGPGSRTFACNPLTNAGCNGGAGEACDDDEHGGFKCYAPPNVIKEGGDCNIVDGPSCAPGLGCSGASERDPDGECARFCCSAADCRSGEKCAVIDSAFGSLGFCK
jgi:hypothetical protein